MKITAENFEEAYKPYLGINQIADSGYATSVKYKKFYGKKPVATDAIDKFLVTANLVIEKEAPSKPATTTTTTTTTTKPTTTKPSTSKAEREAKKAAKEAEKKKKQEERDKKKAERDAKKAEKEANRRPTKPDDCIFAEKPYWYTILESYYKSFVGKKGKQTWRVRAFVKAINQSCDAKLGNKTPEIDIIRKIRTELLPIANNYNDSKVNIPENDSLKNECKTALKKYSISKKKDREDIQAIALSGLCSNKKLRKTW